MDDAAYRILHEHIEPDRIDPQLAVDPDAHPDLPAAVLLEILHGYQKQLLAHDAGGAPPAISPLEALTATRLLVEDLTAAYGWLINHARAAGESWSDIGRALRMSKQAAWERERAIAGNEVGAENTDRA